MHAYGIQKDGTDESIFRAAVETKVENRLGDTVEEAEGEAN